MVNCNKSRCIRFRPSYKHSIDDLILCNHMLSWLDSIKYLGKHFNSNKAMLTDISEVKRKFFSAPIAATGVIQPAKTDLQLLLNCLSQI